MVYSQSQFDNYKYTAQSMGALIIHSLILFHLIKWHQLVHRQVHACPDISIQLNIEQIRAVQLGFVKYDLFCFPTGKPLQSWKLFFQGVLQQIQDIIEPTRLASLDLYGL